MTIEENTAVNGEIDELEVELLDADSEVDADAGQGDVDADDQAGDADSEKKSDSEKSHEQGQDDDEDERQKLGRRAEKRIRKLVAERNAEREERQKLLREVEELRAGLKKTQTTHTQSTLKERLDKLEAQEKSLRADFQRAFEDDNHERLWEIQDELAEVKAQRVYLGAQKATLEEGSDDDQDDDVDTQTTQQTTVVAESPRLRQWLNNNSWFGRDPAKTAQAVEIHKELLESGFDPNDTEDEDYGEEAYYAEIDRRLAELEKGSDSTKPKKPKTAGTSRGSGVKPKGTKIKLTKSQVERAKSLGISVEEYARELMKIQQRQEAS